MTGRPVGDVLRMATEIPGRFARGRGQLQASCRADIIRFRWTDELAIEDVWLAGKRVHRS